MPNEYASLIFVAVAALAFIVLFLYFIPVRLWIAAISSNVPVGLGALIGMRLRRVQPGAIVNPLINAHKAGING
jgi:uncharacterized protein YqfA (UPF0365 family)